MINQKIKMSTHIRDCDLESPGRARPQLYLKVQFDLDLNETRPEDLMLVIYRVFSIN